jgi:hypothetical protein
MESAMSSRLSQCTLAGGIALSLVVLVSSPAAAAERSSPAASNTPPVTLAQATMGAERATRPAPAAYPAYQRGVWEAAAQGPEALRRYVWRTRMIYNFYYYDFAPRY